MGIETLTRGAKRSYEQFRAQETNGVDKALFKTVDMDTSASFMLDKLLHSAFGIVYRDKDNQAHVRQYQAGTGYQYEIPIASEKTRIGEELKDAAVSGIEPTSSQAIHLRKVMDDIVKDHVSGHNLTKWKQALDVIFDGEFYAYGPGGVNLGLGIDFDRAAANELTHDFTGTDTMDIAIKEMQAQLRLQGSSLNNLVLIAGDDWISEFSTDTTVLSYRDANTATELLEMQKIPPQIMNCPHLTALASYRPAGALKPVYVVSFNPGVSYVPYKGAAATDWITSTKAAMFSMDMETYRVYRGIDVVTESGMVDRVAGDVVFDTFSTDDPVADFMRSSTRHCFIPANINHTVVSTGTFS